MIFTNSKSTDFKADFDELLQRGKMDIASVSAIVGNIISEIRTDKNVALNHSSVKAILSGRTDSGPSAFQ